MVKAEIEAAISEAKLLETQAINPESVGVFVGSSIGGFSASDPFFRDYYLSGRTSALVIPLSMNNGPASNISIKYSFQGPVLNVDAACASSLIAVELGVRDLLIRTCDMVLVGGILMILGDHETADQQRVVRAGHLGGMQHTDDEMAVLEQEGFAVTYLQTAGDGLIDLLHVGVHRK